jgi:hypothetical protein
MRVSAALKVRVLLLLWLSGAIIFGERRGFDGAPDFAPQLCLAGLTLLALAVARLAADIRAFLDSIDVRWLLGIHLSRFVGAYFLVLYQEARLPYDFAVIGGVGDIIVAVGAFLLLLGAGAALFPKFLWLWNLVGLADILFVVLTAARLTVSEPGSMIEITQLPLSLLPTFLVPLIITSHLLILLRLTQRRPLFGE